MCGFPILFLCAAVPVIARVAVRFVTSSSLEVVTRLTTNGGRDVLHYYVCELGDAPQDLVICVYCMLFIVYIILLVCMIICGFG